MMATMTQTARFRCMVDNVATNGAGGFNFNVHPRLYGRRLRIFAATKALTAIVIYGVITYQRWRAHESRRPDGAWCHAVNAMTPRPEVLAANPITACARRGDPASTQAQAISLEPLDLHSRDWGDF